jgi:DNA-binding response OmpR family regulator
MMMPGAMNGLDVCRAIKREHLLQHTRVVMLSARGQSSDREAGMAAGADDYMVKPFSPIQILETLQLLETAS